MSLPTTSVTFDMSADEVQASTISLIRHLMTHQPEQPSIEYNMGVDILFQTLTKFLNIAGEHFIF